MSEMGQDMRRLLQTVISRGASDLHLSVGQPPVVRLHGRLRRLNTPPLTPEDTFGLMKSITSERCQQELERSGTTDFAFALEDQARFRVSAFKQKGVVGITLRLIPSQFRSFDQIGLPLHVKNIITRPRGLILVTGPTGCGKTTSLATMINFVNEESDKHIVTIEDPIEYYHPHKRSVVTQREVGVDVPSFDEAMRRVLRQDPDVVMVGEMRDLETMQAAIQAAETGHLVFGTLHTTGAGRTIHRLVDVFPVNQQEQVRIQLATSLLAVISQQLLPTKDGTSRVAAFEIMICTSAIQNLIRENKIHRIDDCIQTGSKQGMILLDDSLFTLYKDDQITYAAMMEASQRPEDLEKKINERRDELKRLGGQ